MFDFRFSETRLKIPKRFTIHITSNCLLKCNFCWLQNNNVSRDVMSIDLFKKIVAWLEEQGVEEIDLTPMVGDFFTVKNHYEYLDIVEQSKIKEYHLITSLTPSANYNLIKYKKLFLYISCYGNNENEFKELTNVDKFNDFVNNLKNLKLYNRGEIIIRNKNFNGIIKSLIKIKNLKIVDCEIDNRVNRFGEPIGFESGCRFLNEPIIHTNGLSLCCMDFQKDKLIIGNLFDPLETIYNNVECSKTLNICNRSCGWYQKR